MSFLILRLEKSENDVVSRAAEFIAKLNVTHPSTVYTINRTGGKLVFPGKTVDADLCPVCQMYVFSSLRSGYLP